MVKYEIIDLPIIAIIGKEGVGTKEKNYSFLKGKCVLRTILNSDKMNEYNSLTS